MATGSHGAGNHRGNWNDLIEFHVFIFSGDGGNGEFGHQNARTGRTFQDGKAILKRSFYPLGGIGLDFIQRVLAHTCGRFFRWEIDDRLEIQAAVVGLFVAWVDPTQRFMAAWRRRFLQFAVVRQEPRVLLCSGHFGRTTR
ncbi:hypothetical protein D3C73_1164650 [compost metagenome]